MVRYCEAYRLYPFNYTVMPRGIEALAVRLIFCCMLASAQEASILVPPTSLTVGVGLVAKFHCNATGRLFNWFVDDVLASSEMIREREIYYEAEKMDGYFVGILTITATARNNNSVIYCSVGSNHGIVDSPKVPLTVQGLLSPPTSLHISYFSDPYHHSLLWNAPFTLDLTNIEPDIASYTVYNNLTNHFVNIEEREYTFPNLCDPIMFSITAQNIVGKGNATSITYEPRNHERPTNISSIEEEVMFLSSNEPNITLRFQVDGNCYDLIQVQLVGNFSNQTMIFGSVIPNVTDAGSVEVILADNITTNEVYNITVSDENAEQDPEVTEDTILTTFDVQRENITCDQGMLKVTCIFARGSMALGCLIIIVSAGNQSSLIPPEKARRQETNNALSRNASHSFNLPVGIYNIWILDVEADGTVDPMRRLYNEIISFNPTCLSPTPTTSLLASSLLAPDSTSQILPPTDTTQASVSVVLTAATVSAILLCTMLMFVLIAILIKFKKWKSKTWVIRTVEGIRSDGTMPDNLYDINPTRSDHRQESLPQGTANTNLDNESGIGDDSTVGSEPEDIDDTPTSVRRNTTTPMYAELNLVYAKVAPPSADIQPKTQYSEIIPQPIEHPPPIHEMEGATAAAIPSTVTEVEKVNLQTLVKHLLNIAPKWQLLGEQLGVSDTLLDEIFTNCKSDQDCLVQMLVFWLRNHDSHPTWREITSALHLMEEHAYAESLEQKACTVVSEGILPGVVSVTRRKPPQKSVVPDGRESSEDEGGSEMMAVPQPFMALAGSEFEV